MKPLPRVDAVPLFPEERAALLELLRSLTPEQWALPSVCAGWSVKDIAAHLVADDLGRLGWQRDGHSATRFESANAETFEADLRAFINRQNESWVESTRRLSPRIVIDLLEWSGRETQALFESLDPNAPGLGVSWAGERESANWFDLAREYAERWHHQAQIREAVGAPMLYERRLFAPLIATMVRGVPHTLRNLDAPDGAHVRIVLHDPNLALSLVRDGGRWQLVQPVPAKADATVELDGDTAWRVFAKNISPAEARQRATITGDETLGERVLQTVSIVA
ncbi:MAG: maleylpyruvate isomerase family mycothiol-dependent enzyme [Chloroflexota bacterium]|nr:maleylpyruvate isomerase family mycothiol-dependent enzyme [Chloroflexota bacterium]